MTTIRRLAIGVVLTAVALALAAPASADPLDGSYTMTYTGFFGGPPVSLTMTPCGQDCTRMANPKRETELRLQDNTWTGSNGAFAYTFDNNTLNGTEVWTAGDGTTYDYNFYLTKNS